MRNDGGLAPASSSSSSDMLKKKQNRNMKIRNPMLSDDDDEDVEDQEDDEEVAQAARRLKQQQEAWLRSVEEREEKKRQEQEEAQGGSGGGRGLKNGKHVAKRRWATMKVTHVTSGAALKASNKAVHTDPLDRARKILVAEQFGGGSGGGLAAKPEPSSDAPIPFSLDKYLFSDPSLKEAHFKELHKPDQWSDVPLLQKGVEITPLVKHGFSRQQGDSKRYHDRRTALRDGIMEDALRPDTLHTATTGTVLGGTRWVEANGRTRPKELRPAGPSLKDLERHEAKVAGVKKYVEYSGGTLPERPPNGPPAPFVSMPNRDLNAAAMGKVEMRQYRKGTRKAFTDPNLLPKFPSVSVVDKVTNGIKERQKAAKGQPTKKKGPLGD